MIERARWSEDALHRWIHGLPAPRALRGSRGHDAAVLASIRGSPVLCVDQTIEGIHFEPGTAPALVGRKAVGRALSDLAATAASPRAVLVALAAPRRCPERWIRGVLAAARATARAHGADLVGGDLSSTRGPAIVSVTAFGEMAARRSPPGRDRARPGQVVVLTGPVGGSRLGRHLRVRPRILFGQRLLAAGATAMMDISDGLAWDLHRLARASRVRIDLDLDAVPVHADARRAARIDRRGALDHALHDGEDHELVATLARSRISAFRTIGRVSRGTGLWIHGTDVVTRRWKPSEGGWKHGA
ncbi:MAG: thiamine-phosphate kinase [Planctomycetota bacterium]